MAALDCAQYDPADDSGVCFSHKEKAMYAFFYPLWYTVLRLFVHPVDIIRHASWNLLQNRAVW